MNLSAMKKLLQISEEVQKPVHVPVVLGNECFIITQQDVRKIEDARFISYHKLGQNGELIPVETVFGLEMALRDALVLANGFQNHGQTINTHQQLLDLLAKCFGQEEPKKPLKASITQQMDWDKSCNTISPPFPFTNSTSTSMSDLPLHRKTKCCCDKPCCCSFRAKYLINKGSNTLENDDNMKHIQGTLSARQMLKIRKTTGEYRFL